MSYIIAIFDVPKAAIDARVELIKSNGFVMVQSVLLRRSERAIYIYGDPRGTVPRYCPPELQLNLDQVALVANIRDLYPATTAFIIRANGGTLSRLSSGTGVARFFVHLANSGPYGNLPLNAPAAQPLPPPSFGLQDQLYQQPLELNPYAVRLPDSPQITGRPRRSITLNNVLVIASVTMFVLAIMPQFLTQSDLRLATTVAAFANAAFLMLFARKIWPIFVVLGSLAGIDVFNVTPPH